MYNFICKHITVEEFNKQLDFIKQYRQIYAGKYIPDECTLSTFNAYLDVKEVQIELVYKDNDKQVVKYITRLDGKIEFDNYNGLDAWRILNKYYKVPRKNDILFGNPEGTKPFMWYSNNYELQKVQAYCYDMNSAYTYAMMQDMPDTNKAFARKIVAEDEIGFNLDCEVVPTGEYGDYVFKKIESPFKLFCIRWYIKKLTAGTLEEKANAKAILNYAVGYMKRENIFLNSYIIHTANQRIFDLIDENTIYCNTDSIVSLVPRNDLKIGKNIGEFKLEHQGLFAYRGFNCQWYGDKVSYRRIPNAWIPDDFDITKDFQILNANKYCFNEEELQICQKK